MSADNDSPSLGYEYESLSTSSFSQIGSQHCVYVVYVSRNFQQSEGSDVFCEESCVSRKPLGLGSEGSEKEGGSTAKLGLYSQEV